MEVRVLSSRGFRFIHADLVEEPHEQGEVKVSQANNRPRWLKDGGGEINSCLFGCHDLEFLASL